MSFLRCMGTNVEITNKRTSSHHSVAERINELKVYYILYTVHCVLVHALYVYYTKVHLHSSPDLMN